jgi:(p)ppGpp synthase/HD superfamily hydrolase
MTTEQEARIDKALTYARNKHAGQKYGGKPFIFHPLLTSEIIRVVLPDDENMVSAALLHDTLEDTKTTPAELTEEFGADVAGLVFEVTKTDYNTFPNLKTRRGVILKFADRLANLVGMETKDKEWQEKYIQKSKFWEG